MATDTGSNYWLFPTGDTPAPPSTLPSEIAALFGPVTRSGYAQAPVDPLSYYKPAPPPVETAPYTGGPTKWWEVYRPTLDAPTPAPTPVTPDLGNVQTFVPTPETVASPSLNNVETFNPTPQQPETPNQPEPNPSEPTPSQDEFPGYAGLKYGDEVPGMPGTRIGDPLFDNAGNQWNWRTGSWIYSNTPREDSYVRDDNAVVTPGGISNILPPEKPPTVVLPPESVTNTPATQTQVIAQPPVFEEKPPVVPQFEFQEPPPALNPIILPGTSVISNKAPTTIPLPILPENPVITRNRETIPSRYFKDINYDPEQILAAAMRSMGGRMARRSILNEQS